jgi:hypothetical protein
MSGAAISSTTSRLQVSLPPEFREPAADDGFVALFRRHF